MGSAANEYANDPGAPRAAAPRPPEDAREELARLRAQVERLMQDRVTPALASAADQAQGYVERARETIGHQADTLSETVRERPLVALAVAAVGGYLMGRLMGGNTYVYPRDR